MRLPNLPSKDIALWYSHMFKNIMKNSNLSEIEKFNNNFQKISEKLKLSLDDGFIDIIVKHGKHIKFITDAPLEWIKYKDTPLVLIKSISRLPIIPGNTLVNSAKHNLITKIPRTNVSFLVINSLNVSDVLYNNGKKLGGVIERIFS